MYNVAYRTRGLPSIFELLQGVTEPSQKVRENNGGRITSTNRRDNVGFNGQTIELAVLPSTRLSRLYQFYNKLEVNLHKPGSDGFIGYVSHSRSRGTAFTVRLTLTENKDFLQALSNMPEVEKVTEEPKGDNAYPSLSHKLSVLLAQ